MLKRKSKDQNGPQEITIRYAAGRMIFEVGGQEFFLTEGTANFLFGRNVQIEFERTHSQDETFGGLRSLSNFVRVRRLMTKGLRLPEIAVVLGVPEAQVRAFYATERAKPHVESWGPNEIEIEREKQSIAEMDFVREASREPTPLEQRDGKVEPGERFIDLRDIRNLRLQGKSDEGIALALGLDKKEFGKFLELNRRYLDLLQ